jgi:hypothetical protein
VLGRANAARRLEEAHKLLEEIDDMLTHMRREPGAASWDGAGLGQTAPWHPTYRVRSR